MQVAGQRVEDGATVMSAGAHQRHFAGEVNPLLDDALAVVILRELRGFVSAQAPLAAAVVAADATLNDRQLAETSKHRRPFAFIRQQLPRGSGEAKLVE